MEGYTTWLNVYHATAHSYGANGQRYEAADARCAEGSGVDLSAGFHKYSARIEPGQITFFFDDVQCGSVHTRATGRTWGFGPDVSRGNWLILDLAVGGAGGQQKPATADARMIVDRVEVRALDAAAPTTAPTPAPTPAPIPASTVQNLAIYRLVNACGGMVLEVPAGRTAAGVALRTGRWSGRDGQRWRAVSVGSGYHKLVNIGTGQTVGVAHGSSSSGAVVIQYPDVPGANAQWRITASAPGAQRLTARHSGQSLDVRGGSAAAGAAVDQARSAAGCAQSWSLVPS